MNKFVINSHCGPVPDVETSRFVSLVPVYLHSTLEAEWEAHGMNERSSRPSHTGRKKQNACMHEQDRTRERADHAGGA